MPLFDFVRIYLDTGRVIIDHIENVDKTEEDCDEETHTTSNNLGSCQEILYQSFHWLLRVLYLRWNNEWCPWDNNEEAWRQIVYNEVLGEVSGNFYVEASEGEVPELTVIVQK